jgi:hypothetical protein
MPRIRKRRRRREPCALCAGTHTDRTCIGWVKLEALALLVEAHGGKPVRELPFVALLERIEGDTA